MKSLDTINKNLNDNMFCDLIQNLVLVIGGGASGMIAAGFAADQGAKVILIEKNEKLGKKIYITGKGRCNVCNIDVGQEFLSNVVNGGKFLNSCINNFNYYDLADFFNNQNIKLKVERGGRVFPESDKASDIIKGLTQFLKKKNVEIKLDEFVENIVVEKYTYLVTTNKDVYKAKKVIIATGGLSYKSTGSTGDGLKFAAKLGLKIDPTVPALVPIRLQENVKELEGLTLKNVRISVKTLDKFNYVSQIGEMIFTSDGVSGPLVLTCSSYINRIKLNNAILEIDLKPALTEKQLDERIVKDFRQMQNKEFKNALAKLLPNRLLNYFLVKCCIDLDKKVNLITKQERKNIVFLLKHFSFCIKELYNINAAVITSGGIDLSEINPKTMECKKYPGLYFVGEVLNVDALTGGYNLQIAFSTGAAAGQHAGKCF